MCTKGNKERRRGRRTHTVTAYPFGYAPHTYYRGACVSWYYLVSHKYPTFRHNPQLSNSDILLFCHWEQIMTDLSACQWILRGESQYTTDTYLHRKSVRLAGNNDKILGSLFLLQRVEILMGATVVVVFKPIVICCTGKSESKWNWDCSEALAEEAIIQILFVLFHIQRCQTTVFDTFRQHFEELLLMEDVLIGILLAL